MSISCNISKYSDEFEIEIYDAKTNEKSEYSEPKNKPIQEIVDELVKNHGNDIEKIVIDDDLKSDELEDLKHSFTKYNDIIDIIPKENKAVELCTEYSRNSIACGIEKNSHEFKINLYDAKRKKKKEYSRFIGKSVQEIIDELITRYGSDIENIVIDESNLEPDELEQLKKENSEKYNNLVYIATKEELDFNYYLKLKVEYSIGDLIISCNKLRNILYECTEITDGRMIWKLLNEREYELNGKIDFGYTERMFRLKMNQVHVVFENSQENVNLIYGSEFDKYSFKSINFIEYVNRKPIILSKFIFLNPDISILVKTISYYEDSPRSYSIQDWGFIHIPNSIKEHESRKNIMETYFESNVFILNVLKNEKVQMVPFDEFSGCLWTESAIILNTKLLFIYERDNSIEAVWNLQFKVNKEHQLHMEWSISEAFEQALLAEINKCFLERIVESEHQYKDKFKSEHIVKKVIITVPRYFNEYRKPHSLISCVIDSMKLANIEIIDIIENTHSDLLYYLSDENHLNTIEAEKKIAVFDIEEETFTCRIYQISEYKDKKYATCIGEVLQFIGEENKLSGRDIHNIIAHKLEESIPEDLRNEVRLKILETARKIKCDLSSNERVE